MRSVRGTVGETRARVESGPWLFALGFAVSVVTLASLNLAGLSTLEYFSLLDWRVLHALVATAVSVTTAQNLPQTLAFLVAFGFFRATLSGALVGALLPAIRGEGDWVGQEDVDLAAVGAEVWRLLVGGVFLWIASVGAVVGLFGVYGAVVTVLQATGYALGVGAGPLNYWANVGGLGTAVAAVALVAVTGGLAGGDVAGGSGYAASIRRRGRTLARTPWRALAHGAVVVGLWTAPLLIASVLLTAGGPVPGVAAFFGVGTVAYTVLPVYRTLATEETDASSGSPAPAQRESSPGGRRRPLDRRRVALAAVVLLAALGGAMALRVADVRPTTEAPPPGFDADSSRESLQRSFDALSRREHASVSRTYVRRSANGSEHLAFRMVRRYDRSDWQVSAYEWERSAGRWQFDGIYVDDGSYVYTERDVSGRSRVPLDAVRAREAVWKVVPLGVSDAMRDHLGGRIQRGWTPGDYRTFNFVTRERNFGTNRVGGGGIVPGGYESFPLPVDAWRVVERSNGTVVLETPTVEAFENVLAYSPEGELLGGTARVYVDADTGLVERVETLRDLQLETDRGETVRRRFRTVTTFEYGSVEVTRPPGAPDRWVDEYVYDALVY